MLSRKTIPWLVDRLLLGLVALAVADWIALRQGWVGFHPRLLAVLVGLVLVLALVSAGCTVRGLWRRRLRPGLAAARLLLLFGLLAAGAGGLANWLYSLQGVVVLAEGEAVPLNGGGHLQEFAAGPLARLDEMRLALALDELELVPAAGGGFFPRSLIRVVPERGAGATLEVDPFSAPTFGTLRFHQGAFGFAPRIVILHERRQILDRVVPFLSRREGEAGLSFRERFTISREGLEVEGAVDLGSLDEGMRGHAALILAVSRDGRPLGRGALLPGHFAEIGGGYRVGFADLHRWSEIDISRRTYNAVVLTGAALGLGGALLWPLAVWRRW